MPPEAVQPNLKSAPRRPTQAEIDLHNTCHSPFRSWCKHCLKGKGVSDQHRRRNPELRDKPMISIDYAFLTSIESDTLPILVYKDKARKYIKTMIVPKKGKDPAAVEFLCSSIRDAGYGKDFLLRSDQEHSIVALREKVCEIMGGVPEDAPLGDSGSNGDVENAVRQAVGQIRTLKSGLEERTTRGNYWRTSDNALAGFACQ